MTLTRRILTLLAVPVLALMTAVAAQVDQIVRIAAQEGRH